MSSPLATALMTSEALPKTNISPTNVVGAYQMSTDAAMNRYKAQLAQQMGTFGGLASLGGTAMGAFGPKIFDKAFPTAPPAPDYTSGIIGAAGDSGVAAEAAPLGGMAGYPAAAEGAGTVAGGLAAAMPEVAEAGAMALPEWLMAALPFLAL